nr:1844_t:CDS:2 [Entrophospora candida]
MTTNSVGSEKTSVQVALRIRPITNEDVAHLPTRLQRQVITATPTAPNTVVVQSDKKLSFNYDHVFGPDSSQQEVYDKAVINLVENFLEGYNVTILAYGQTSSGKTHTMGTADNNSIPPESKGIIPRAMDTLFNFLNSPNYKTRRFSLKVSFVELYNEDLIDLLGEGHGDLRPQVMIREDAKGNILWSGLQEIRVNSVEEVMSYLAHGSLNRQVGATDMNSQSSRSHAIFSVTMVQQKASLSAAGQSLRPGTPSKLESKFGARQASNTNLRLSRRFDEGELITVTSKFHFVDLAGSERLKRTSALNERAKEGISINSGLLALGNVISALGDPNKAKHTTHIPYRDSKLTRLLQDSLGGNAQTLMIACVSSAEYNLNETINTLKYANRARNIKNNAVLNQEEIGWNDLEHLQSLVLKLRIEIKNLKSGSNSNNGSNNSSGRNTPTHNEKDGSTGLQPPQLKRLNSSLSINSNGSGSLTYHKSDKDVDALEEKLSLLQSSYVELSQRYAKQSAALALHQDNTDNVDGNPRQLSSEEKESILKQAAASFQEAVEPVIEEYEKSTSALESKLAVAHAALNHTENMMNDQEMRIEIAEQANEQSYIHELETRLASSEEELKKFVKNVEKLEKHLQQREQQCTELEIRLKDSTSEEEKKSLLNQINDRDGRIAQLEEKVDDLARELDLLKRQSEQKVDDLSHELNVLKQQSEQKENINDQISQEITTSGLSPASEDDRLYHFSPILGKMSLKDEQDRLAVVALEQKLSELQKTHEKTVQEFSEIKSKHESCIQEIQDLQSQLSESRMADSGILDDLKSTTPSTPATPMTPYSIHGGQNPIRMSLPPINLSEIKDNSEPKHGLHRKTQSLSNEMKEFEQYDATHLSMIQRLQNELKQLESLNEDKGSGLEAVKQEFARLEMNHRQTLETVEELREEIKRRDAIAQSEASSVITSESNSKNNNSAISSELDELDIINRNREEAEQKIELISELERVKKDYGLQEQLVISLEKELNMMRQELKKEVEEINEKNTNELESLKKSLENALKQRDEEQKNVNKLEIEIKTLKEFDSNDDESLNELREQLINSTLENEEKNKLITELNNQLTNAEKEHELKIQQVNELTRALENKELEYKEIIESLHSKIMNLESQLEELKKSSQTGQNNISNLGNQLANAETQLEEFKESEGNKKYIANDLEEKLKEVNIALSEKEKLLSTKDSQIAELESIVQKNRLEHENAKLSETAQADLVKDLQSQLGELEKKLKDNKNSSSSELIASKESAAKNAKLVEELEAKLKFLEKELPTTMKTGIDSVALTSAELEEIKRLEVTQEALIKDLKTELEEKQDSLSKLEETVQQINGELESVRTSENNKSEFINTLEMKLKEAENNYSTEALKLKDAKDEIEDLKRQCKTLENQLCVFQKDNDETVDDNAVVEDLTNQLKKAHDEIKEYQDHLKELENISKQVEADKNNQIDVNVDLTHQIKNLQKELERMAEELTESTTENESIKTLSQKQKDPNEDLKQKNNELGETIKVSEERVVLLTENVKILESEVERLKSVGSKGFTAVSVDELKSKISELEAEKEGLEEANKAFCEERKKLDQKIDSLLKQLQTAGREGNKGAAQLSELHARLTEIDQEYNNYKQKSITDIQEMESEITRLIDVNQQLEKELSKINSNILTPDNVSIKSRSSVTSFDVVPPSPGASRANNLDSTAKTKLNRQENKIIQQSNIIKVLQDKVMELERRLVEETSRRRRPSNASGISVTDVDNSRLSTMSTVSNNSSSDALKKVRPGMIATPPNSSRPDSNTEVTVEIQKLQKKLARLEGDNLQSRHLVATLENSLTENEDELRVAKQQLQFLQKEKTELLDQIKALRSQLDETTAQFEHAKSSVYEEKKDIEKVLEVERKAKENAEKARRQLESRMEELMAKKSKFMCF